MKKGPNETLRGGGQLIRAFDSEATASLDKATQAPPEPATRLSPE